MRFQPIKRIFWLGLISLLSLPAAAETVKILVQSSPLAGSQYYALSEAWPQIKPGDRLTLTREPDNRHDRNAIRVDWNGRLYDCDFNIALGLPVSCAEAAHIRDFDPEALARRQIVTGPHCFACAAGHGSSCGGALDLL